MAKSLAQLKHPFVKITGDFPTDDVFVIAAHIKEGLNKIAEMRIIFAIKHNDMPLEQVLGKNFTVEVKTKGPDDADKRNFTGACIEAEFMGLAQGYDMYGIELRPWPWFLTQMNDNRIFQDKTIPEIITEVFSDAGFSDYTNSLTGSYQPRPYVVQYDETNFEFILRMMEEEGIYFFFDWSGSVEKLVLADDRGAHSPIAGTSELEYKPRVMKAKREENTIFEFNENQKVVPGKVSLVDRKFENSRTKIEVTQDHTRGSHSHNSYEQYRMHGHYGTASEGEHYARVAVDAHAHEAQRYSSATNVRTVSAGATLKMKENPVGALNTEYLILEAEHFLQVEVENEEQGESGPQSGGGQGSGSSSSGGQQSGGQGGGRQGGGGGGGPGELEQLIINKKINFPNIDDLYFGKLSLGRASDPFRPVRTQSWPKMEGLHRATVVGPSGEEIYTDEYGRIKVQFFWDRDGEENENSSCWIRVMQPWSQKGFGTVYIPRIGAEVLIMFERNDPNYPICIGSLYNDFETVPYPLPDNMTQTVMFKSKSTKNGGEDNFHEMVLEDKINEEFIRLQSERDWFEKIKNNAEITIGMEHQDPGDMSLTVYHDLNETLKTGNHTLMIEQGDQSYTVDQGKQTIEVEGDHTMTVRSGNHDTTVSSGNHALTVSSGNQTTSISAGKQEVTAAQSITLKVGGSSIKIEPAKITLSAAQIEITGQGQISASAPSVKVAGSAMTEITGGMVKIN